MRSSVYVQLNTGKPGILIPLISNYSNSWVVLSPSPVWGLPTFRHEERDPEASLCDPLPEHREAVAVEGKGAAHQDVEDHPEALQDKGEEQRGQSGVRAGAESRGLCWSLCGGELLCEFWRLTQMSS